MELLIMAAGMGSRFGGLKQIEPMGPNGEFIIDYSIYDAKKAGFDKVVFIIKEENYEVFKNTIGKRIEPYIDVDYVFQKMEDIPSFVNIPENRVKPWGTAQAIYAAKDKITGPFLVINADDFYGRDAYFVARDFLKSDRDNKFSTIGYKANNTMTENGSVKRGVIKHKNGNLLSINESKLEYVDGEIIATSLVDNEVFKVEKDDLVSMNMLTFDLSIFPFLKERMDIFFKENENDLEKCEFLIPVEIENALKAGKEVKVLDTKAKWHGVTYKEDTDNVKKSIKKMVLKKEYPNNLWEN
ncbi:MAG: nucleotidyltransferase [Bacilli bacterium]|nr:nucleotidyltransferase [Bacilli bacterium]